MINAMLKQILKDAQKKHYAIGQFNFSTIEQLKGILAAAREKRSPVILGTSEGENKFLGLKETIALVEISKTKYKVPAFLNLDHGKDLKWIKQTIDYGYPAVHFDGSELALEENIKYAKEVVRYAHKKGVLVEGELGYLRGKSGFHKKITRIRKEDLTLPEQVEKFVKETKVDSLAIAIGNVHGIYSQMPKLDFERLKEIREKTNTFLVLHGGSGISNKEIKRAIKLGIVKININTELRLVWKNSLKNFFKRNPQEIKPYKILVQVQTAIQKKVGEKVELFGSKSRA